MSYEIHPAANIFPMMDAVALRELADDIKAHGQRDWIELYEGKVIDGRNRMKACELVDEEPQFCEIEEEINPVEYVLSKNLYRRHLNESQRSMIGARAKGVYSEEAKERKRSNGGDKKSAKAKEKSEVENLPPPVKARDQAAAAVAVSGKSIDHAAAVLDKGSPELVAAVDAGKVAVSKAAKIAKTVEPAKQMEAVKEAPARTEKTPFEQLAYWWGKADSAAQTRFRLWIDGDCT